MPIKLKKYKKMAYFNLHITKITIIYNIEKIYIILFYSWKVRVNDVKIKSGNCFI